MRRAYPRLTKFESWQYAQVRQAAERWAVGIGTASVRGAAVLWSPRPELQLLIQGKRIESHTENVSADDQKN